MPKIIRTPARTGVFCECGIPSYRHGLPAGRGHCFNMQYTIFDVPLLKNLLRGLSILVLNIFGWRREGRIPDIPKYVVIAAPHTSNWDFPITLAMLFAFKLKVYWMGKDTLFCWPFRPFFRFLGGIPIDRSRSANVVEQSIQAFRERAKLAMMISPEGTRRNVSYWKTGFYYIASGAGVPIVLGFLDYLRKAGGFGHVMEPTGDMDADMEKIHVFYAGVTGRHPEKFSPGAILSRK